MCREGQVWSEMFLQSCYGILTTGRKCLTKCRKAVGKSSYQLQKIFGRMPQQNLSIKAEAIVGNKYVQSRQPLTEKLLCLTPC